MQNYQRQMTFIRHTFFTSVLLSGIIGTCLSLHSCSPKKPIDRTAYNEELQQRGVKRLTKAEIIAKGEEIGKSAISLAATNLQKHLKNAITTEGIAGAIKYCNLNATGLVKNLEDSLGVEITRVTDKPRNPMDSLSAKDKEIWEAYVYANETEQAQIQELDENTLIMTKPIAITNGLCLNCHGAPGGTITQANYDSISQLYPADKAINYQIGDLRGMWRVLIPIKTIAEQSANVK